MKTNIDFVNGKTGRSLMKMFFPIFAATVLILSGGFGNLIDRVFRGYVVDFLQFSFFSPVCNAADYYITIGAVLLVISVMFCKKNIAPRQPEPEKTN